MESKDLKDIFFNQVATSKVLDYINNNNFEKVKINGLFGSSLSFLISCCTDKGMHVVIMESREDAQFLTSDLYNLIDSEAVYFFPDTKTEKSHFSNIREASQKVQRSATISAIKSWMDNKYAKDNILIISYPAAVNEGIVSHEFLNNNLLTINKSEKLSHDFIKDVLCQFNFEKVEFVSEPGQYALRGGIIDIFSFSDNEPFRIDFFGNEVEKICKFDINTQLSKEEYNSIQIFPNIYDNVQNESTVGLLDFLGKLKYTVWCKEISYIEPPIDKKNIIISALPFKNTQQNGCICFNTKPQPSFNKNFDILSDDINKRNSDGYKVLIASDNSKQLERLKSIFAREEEKSDKMIPYFDELHFSLNQGFIDDNKKICVYTDHQIFDRYHRVKIKREVERSERLTLNELNAFQIGDYVVHIDHGVGIFGGLVKTNINGKVQEAVKLIYKDNDVIFVSIHGIHRISKYKSKDSAPPKIYKLGTGAWEKLKEQTKSKVKDIASDLIKLYAQRIKSKGFAFSPDSYLQHELEASFIYEDTPDQLKTTQAVKDDMERSYPMDRLVCGDVGFGKTEIAIRAAFKAVTDSKQVALLVPTTILALQHYKTFLRRLRNFPCTIEFVSRLKTAKEIKDIADKLKEGKIDIIIGTHRLLNKEIIFKDLGLLIIDEEQKFGVAAKERLRHLKLSVDTLTLSATPIPRTLQFSLLGARDLSIINTPPPNRLPIQTEIIGFDEAVIRDAINFEIERGGQVFFVHNKVEDILAVEDIVKKICPGVKTCVGHGQMEPKQLENIVLDFMAGDYDVIVATSIVENGIDIPNANTIIINQAQNFGLSDLHQLRGRVGRSNLKAFCYLIVPSMLALTDDARRRLRAIEAFSDLGSGFNIAMQDLDIRGAGNLLGGEQSGFIADMGFETYQKILAEAFTEIQQSAAETGLEIPDVQPKTNSLMPFANNKYVSDCAIDTDLELLIPDSYVSLTSEKIRLYKELDAISTEEQLSKFREEMEDRFGPLPVQLEQLMFVVRLRQKAIGRGIEKIVIKNNIMLAYFVSNKLSPFYSSDIFAGIMQTISTSSGRFLLKEQNGKLLLRVANINNVESAYKILNSFY